MNNNEINNKNSNKRISKNMKLLTLKNVQN